MLKLTFAAVVAVSFMGGNGLAADIVHPTPDPDPVFPVYPEPDYGLKEAFYLRGSVGANVLTSSRVVSCCAHGYVKPTQYGIGYSIGGGAGYEFGNGFRADVTIDYFRNKGLTAAGYSADLRSTIALANVYYDFDFSGHGHSAEGGLRPYIGAGLGKAFSVASAIHPSSAYNSSVGPMPNSESNTAFAAAIMAGVGYDMGALVADIGYRGTWIKGFSTGFIPSGYHAAGNNMWAKDDWLHEIRASLRYRFN